MDNTLDALRNLYVALGGDADDVADLVITPALINAVAELITAGLTEAMPAVTAEDNGKVLTVVSGEWKAAALPSDLPAVTADDNGKILKVVDGAWAAASAT